MSGEPGCNVRSGHDHRVLDRKCNYSAFNGYHRTRSDYSAIRCVETGAIWRTKAAYVDELPDETDPKWRRR